jgi:nitroreductase/ketosteroid isomerase-like protein
VNEETSELAARFVDTVLGRGDLDRDLYTADATGWHNVDDRTTCLADAPDDSMKTLFRLVPDAGPEDVRLEEWSDGFLIRYVMGGTLPDGSPLHAPACVVVTVRDGRVAAIEEYLDSAQFAGAATATAKLAGVEPPPFDLAEIDRLLTTTRSVRKRLDFDRPVDRHVLLDCVRLAQQAPTGSNMQGWRWIFVTDPEQKQALGDVYRKGGAPYLAAGRDLEIADPQVRKIRESSLYLAENMERAPVLAVPCLKGRPPADAPYAAWAGAFSSIVPAVWSFQLALRARGLGSCFTNLHLLCEEEAAQVLGLPADVLQIALLPIAYTIGTNFRPAERPDPEKIVRWERWDQREAKG